MGKKKNPYWGPGASCRSNAQLFAETSFFSLSVCCFFRKRTTPKNTFAPGKLYDMDTLGPYEEEMASEGQWMEALDGRVFSEVVAAEIQLRQELEKRNMELESQWTELKQELENLRDKREQAEEEAEEVRRKQKESEKMVKQLSAALTHLSAKNAELDNFWSESAAKFKTELEKLQRKGRDAEKARKTLNERNKKLKEKLFNRNQEWQNFYNALGPDGHANEQQIGELKRLNKLVLNRVEQLKDEVKCLKSNLNDEKKLREKAEMDRDESLVFAQADAWQQEAKTFTMDKMNEELDAERVRASYLEQELEKCRRELSRTKEIAVSATQASAESELKLFQEAMRAERANDEAKEAVLMAGRFEESLRQAEAEKEALQATLDALLVERQKNRLDAAKAIGERDYYEWKFLERSVSCVEWIAAPDELVTEFDEEEAGWNSNVLFGTENKLYESGE